MSATSVPLALTESLFGAVADSLSDAMDAAVYESTGMRGETAAALTAVLHNAGLGVKDLARILGMRSPSAVELIGRLEERGLMRRRPGADSRTRSLELTAKGRRSAAEVLAARRRTVADRLALLTKQEQRSLHDLLARLLAGSRSLDLDVDQLCRRCDEAVCTPRRCPVSHGTQ